MKLRSFLSPMVLFLSIFTSHCGQGLVLDTEPVLDLVEGDNSVQSNSQSSTGSSNGTSGSFSTTTTGTNSFGSTGGSTSGATGTNTSGSTGTPTTGAVGSAPGNPFFPR